MIDLRTMAWAIAQPILFAFAFGFVGFQIGMIPNYTTSDPSPNGLLMLLTTPLGMALGFAIGLARSVRMIARARDDQR
jgi:hypothetical protein